jgi:hypothetical protein
MRVNLALERRYYSSPNLQDSSEHIHNTRSIHICRGNGGKGETIRFIHANDKIGNISSTHIQHIISTSTPEALEKYLESLVLSPKILVELIETRRRNPMSPQLPTPAAPQYTSRPTTSTTQSKTSSDQMGPHATLVSPDSSIFMTALAVERVLDSPVVKTVWIGPRRRPETQNGMDNAAGCPAGPESSSDITPLQRTSEQHTADRSPLPYAGPPLPGECSGRGQGEAG